MANNVIKELLQKAKLTAENDRRAQIEKRLNIYHDNYISIIKDEVNNQFSEETRENVRQMVDNSQNILKRIIKEISLVYQQEAKRSYIVGNKENQRYQDVMATIPTDVIMQEINRLTNVCNKTAVYVVPRNNKIEYDILTPDQMEVFQNEEDPTKIDALVFLRSYVDTVDVTHYYKIYWDIYGNHIRFDEDDQVVEDYGNPYKDPNNPGQFILPFAFFDKDYIRDCFWNATGGQDIVDGTIQVGVLLTYFNYLMKTNTFKQLYMTGVDADETPARVILDQLHPLVVKDQDADIGAVDYQTAVKEIWETIYSKIGSIANNYGLSMDDFKLTKEAQSGFALEIKNLGLERVIVEQKKMYRYGEENLFDITKIVNNTMFKGNKIPDGGTFSIDFSDPVYPEDPEEVRRQWTFDMKIGARNVYDYVRHINPDIKDDKEADKQIKANTEANQKVLTDYGINIDELIKNAVGGGEAGGGALV